MSKPQINSELALKLKEDYLNGFNVSELSEMYNINMVYISCMLKACDVEVMRRPSSKEIKKRNKDIKLDYENGLSLNDMVEKYGLSGSSIYAIAKKAGASRPKKISKNGKELLKLISDYPNIDLFESITPRERKVLELRFGLKDGKIRDLMKTGKELWLSGQRISQIENKALRKVKKTISIHKARITREENKKKWLAKQEKYKLEWEQKTQEEKQEILDMFIEELDLSVRAYNCLKRVGINTVWELVDKTEHDIKKIRNLGQKALHEIKYKLALLGLELTKSE